MRSGGRAEKEDQLSKGQRLNRAGRDKDLEAIGTTNKKEEKQANYLFPSDFTRR